jgi:hypothetical protein
MSPTTLHFKLTLKVDDYELKASIRKARAGKAFRLPHWTLGDCGLMGTRYIRGKIIVTTYFTPLCIDAVDKFPTSGALKKERRAAFFAITTRIQNLGEDFITF